MNTLFYFSLYLPKEHIRCLNNNIIKHERYDVLNEIYIYIFIEAPPAKTLLKS